MRKGNPHLKKEDPLDKRFAVLDMADGSGLSLINSKHLAKIPGDRAFAIDEDRILRKEQDLTRMLQ